MLSVLEITVSQGYVNHPCKRVCASDTYNSDRPVLCISHETAHDNAGRNMMKGKEGVCMCQGSSQPECGQV